MYKECPNCRKGYNMVLEKKDSTAPAWQRERLISGLCSERCWREYLSIPKKKKLETNTCLNKCKFFRKFRKNEGTDSGHDGLCFSFKAIKMFNDTEGWEYSFDELVTASEKGQEVFDVYELQNKKCLHYQKKEKRRKEMLKFMVPFKYLVKVEIDPLDVKRKPGEDRTRCLRNAVISKAIDQFSKECEGMLLLDVIHIMVPTHLIDVQLMSEKGDLR